MKTFYFSQNDNIYNIFQVIEKIPSKYKEVLFDIDKDNEFFNNRWWLKLVLEKAKDKWLKINFVIENQKQESLMKSLWINYIWKKIPIYKRIQKSILDFLELFKSEHGFYKRHYNIIKIFFLMLEIWLVFFLVYYLYNLVTPKTDIYIQPAVKTKTLVNKIYIYPEKEQKNYTINSKKPYIPYKQEEFEKIYSLKLPVKDIQYITKPSSWIVKFYNETLEWLSLKANTLLRTENGLLFRLTNWVYIPPKDGNGNPWTAKVKVRAEDMDEKWNIMWERWNLLEWTELFIKKVYLSYWKKKIYAKAVNDFSNGETKPKWEVSLQDIELLKKQLFEKLKNNIKLNITKYIQAGNNTKIPLLYDKLYWYKDISYEIYSRPWEKTAYIKWDVKFKIYFSYLDKKDIKKVFDSYLNDRIVSENNFLAYDENSIEILKNENVSKWLYLITISINALLWYDFDNDYNNVIYTIINQVKWKDIEKAKNIILSYDEIAACDIKTTNTLKKISNLKSRIYIHINK